MTKGDVFNRSDTVVVVLEVVNDRYVRVADRGDPDTARLWRTTSLQSPRAERVGRDIITVKRWEKLQVEGTSK